MPVPAGDGASAEGADTAGVHAMVGFGLAYRIGDLEKAGAGRTNGGTGERVKKRKVHGSGLRPEPRGASGVRNGGLGLPRPPGLTVCFALELEGKLRKARAGNPEAPAQ